jgi:hypothetical protein
MDTPLHKKNGSEMVASNTEQRRKGLHPRAKKTPLLEKSREGEKLESCSQGIQKINNWTGSQREHGRPSNGGGHKC